MTNLLETAKTTTQAALGHLRAAVAGLTTTLLAGTSTGEAHLTGAQGAACLRASTLDEDLDVLLHEIQRRRARA